MATAAEIKAFIQEFGRLAVIECNNRIAAGKGFVLPSVCLAQSALETGWGDSGLMVKANAYFGIKAGGSWTGAVYRADTWEVDSGGAYNTTANFRAYGSKAESVADYMDLITSLPRYAGGVSYGTDKSKWLTPKATITAIWSGGYATDTLYVEKIMNTINARNLTEWDNLVTGDGTPALDNKYFSFTAADLLQGSLVAIDSNRTYTNNTTSTLNVSLDWNKHFQVSTDSTLKLTIPDKFIVLFRRVLNDSTTSDPTEYKNGDNVTFAAGERVAFTFKHVDGEEITPASFSGTVLTLSNLPAGEESYDSAIAFFVKIE